jgi:hypothetical protein
MSRIAWRKRLTCLFAAAIVALFCRPVSATLAGGDGNRPIRDPGWPAGAALLFNDSARVAWWEELLFDGQWHAEYRGDATAINRLLNEFAKVEAKTKRIIIHDGTGRSVWSWKPNSANGSSTRIDWSLAVWEPAKFKPEGDTEQKDDPPAQLDVYTGGKIRWRDMIVPKGVEVVDERLEAHGFSANDGLVLQGNVRDSENQNAIAAQVELERVEPQGDGNYRYHSAKRTDTDEKGNWLMKHVPAGWHRIVLRANGYVPRVINEWNFEDQPGWRRFDGKLSLSVVVSGRVVDESGKPLDGVQLRASGFAKGVGYNTPEDNYAASDKAGLFHLEKAPKGMAEVHLHKAGYCAVYRYPVIVPAEKIELTMFRAADLHVSVNFTSGKRAKGYVVQLEPESGANIEKPSRFANVDEKGEITFADQRPGRYVVYGYPTPYTQNDSETKRTTVELKPGETANVKLSAP